MSVIVYNDVSLEEMRPWASRSGSIAFIRGVQNGCPGTSRKTIGTGTDFARVTNGYIASFLTDANDPALLEIPEEQVNTFLKDKVKGESFNKFIVIKDSKNGPDLTWVEIGISDLSNVEIVDGLDIGDVIYILPSMSLIEYQKRFKERVNRSFSFGA